MLKGIDPLLSPELLKIVSEMGHGEEVVLVDANFTSQTLGHIDRNYYLQYDYAKTQGAGAPPASSSSIAAGSAACISCCSRPTSSSNGGAASGRCSCCTCSRACSRARQLASRAGCTGLSR